MASMLRKSGAPAKRHKPARQQPVCAGGGEWSCGGKRTGGRNQVEQRVYIAIHLKQEEIQVFHDCQWLVEN
jgi:hypothetical protein